MSFLNQIKAQAVAANHATGCEAVHFAWPSAAAEQTPPDEPARLLVGEPDRFPKGRHGW